MKRILTFLCVLVLLACLSTFGVAASADQHIVLSTFGESVMLTAKNAPAAWELPALKNGEALREASKLTLENATDAERRITLDHVALPYDNATALEYLNHLYITVRDGKTVLYNGTYSRINDEDGLKLDYTLAAGESVDLTIDLRCDYTFGGSATGFENGSVIDWKFYTVIRSEVPNKDKPSVAFDDPALREVLIAACLSVVLLVGVGVYEIIKKKR